MGDSRILDMTARSLAAAIRSREVSPVEALEACLARVDQVNDRVNAIIWRNDDQARTEAAAMANRLVKGSPDELPPFLGVPIPIKDLTRVAGWPITFGSLAAPPGPSAQSEMIVDAYRRAGFLLTARTNTPELGPITASENDRYGLSRNPWDLDRTPGGSSGGAGAAAAARMFPVAHGNDGGGSLRIPASCCGLVGLKVARGRVPQLVNEWEGGVVGGVISRDVADTAAILDVICGPDRAAWYNAPPPERPFLDEVGADPGRLRIGVVEAAPYGLPLEVACLDAVRAAGQKLEELGHLVEQVSFDPPDDFLDAFLKVVDSGYATYYDAGIDWERVEPHNRANRARAESVSSVTYVHNVHRLQRMTRELVPRWGSEFDLLLTPTMSILPPKAGEILEAVHSADSSGPSLQVFQMAVFTAAFNLTGQPAISLPLHATEQGLPVGVQIVAGPWEEAILLRIAAQLEQAAPWSDLRPPL